MLDDDHLESGRFPRSAHGLQRLLDGTAASVAIPPHLFVKVKKGVAKITFIAATLQPQPSP